MARIHAAMDEVLVSYEDGETTRTLEGYDLQCLACSPAEPDRVFVGTFENGLQRSTDGGRSFERLEADFVSDAVLSLAVSPHDPDTVYAGTEPSRVYRSDDGGGSWTRLEGIADLPSEEEWYFPPRPDTHHTRWIEVDPFDPDRLYVGIEAGALLISEDGGDSWRERPPGSRRDNHSLATHPGREGRVYSAAGDGFAVSDDGGDSWTHPQEGLDHRYCWSVVPDPDDPDRVLLSSASGASSAHTAERAEAYVYRCGGLGGRWERLEGEFPTGEGVVRAEFSTHGGVVYGVTNRGVFRSPDFGDSWERVGLEWDEDLEALAPRGFVVVS
ncbi:hypothetical protein [Saliphagus sp. LR7]|uniref:WD40/YVTN/BNR-like repeat-containing protein n=1 Tax=Saliphagus sp. LR7 TaxID=2282654 RepID=UPI000DF73602|nr:hypothetical protein [Saliphagus sp. LR7]